MDTLVLPKIPLAVADIIASAEVGLGTKLSTHQAISEEHRSALIIYF